MVSLNDKRSPASGAAPFRLLIPIFNFGGRGEIRTHGCLAATPVFKTGAIDRSATLPFPDWRDIRVKRHQIYKDYRAF